MSLQPDLAWQGTSDAESVLGSRASTTPAQRLRWLEGSLVFAQLAGTLGRERSARKRTADDWAGAVEDR